MKTGGGHPYEKGLHRVADGRWIGPSSFCGFGLDTPMRRESDTPKPPKSRMTPTMFSPRLTRRHRLARVAIAAIAAAAASSALPAAAQASEPAAGCPDAPLTNPFTPWNDGAPYELAPDGGLEAGGASWALAGGAVVVEGNETFNVGGPSDHRSLSMPTGATARTATMCIGVEHRTMRFFTKRIGAGQSGTLKVEVLYTDANGNPQALQIGALQGTAPWAPTAILPMLVNELAPEQGNAMQVAFRFTPQGGTWSIDDVYVDPLRRV